MNQYMQVAMVSAMAVASVALVVAAFQLRSIRDILATQKIKVVTYKPKGSPTDKGWVCGPAGYALFVFRDGQWVLEADLSKAGYEAVTPTIPGSFEGQVVKKESALKPKA